MPTCGLTGGLVISLGMYLGHDVDRSHAPYDDDGNIGLGSPVACGTVGAGAPYANIPEVFPKDDMAYLMCRGM